MASTRTSAPTPSSLSVDSNGRQLATRTVAATSAGHLDVLRWAAEQVFDRRWAIEDCRHLSRRLESDLLAGGEHVVRVPPKLMAHVRDSARTYGKSDPIDALAVARAALREPDLPTACLDGPEREVRLLTDLRESLVSQRTSAVNRLHWRLHEIDPSARSLDRASNYDQLEARIEVFDSLVARLAQRDITECRRLTIEINELEEQLRVRIEWLAPTLLALVGCATLTAAKILGETGGVTRFKSSDAFARHNGTAPLRVVIESPTPQTLPSRKPPNQRPSTESRSPKSGSTSQIKISTPDVKHKATVPSKLSAFSTSQTSSTEPSLPTPNKKHNSALDRGARDTPGHHRGQQIGVDRG